MPAIFFVFMLAFYIGIPVAIFVWARRMVRALENRTTGGAQLAAMQEQLLRLEQRVDDLADENERLLEGQKFMQQLLASRAGGG